MEHAGAKLARGLVDPDPAWPGELTVTVAEVVLADRHVVADRREVMLAPNRGVRLKRGGLGEVWQ